VRKSAKAAVTKLAPGGFFAKAPTRPQNEHGQSSAGSRTDAARLKIHQARKTTTSFQAFRKICDLQTLHPCEGPIRFY